MNYLYVDSTESGLTTNFLEVLRDAIDFGVFVLEADEKIGAGKTKASTLGEEARAEIARVEAFTSTVAAAIESAEKGANGSPAAVCAMRVSEQLTGTSRQTVDAVRARLAADNAAIDAEEEATREACQTKRSRRSSVRTRQSRQRRGASRSSTAAATTHRGLRACRASASRGPSTSRSPTATSGRHPSASSASPPSSRSKPPRSPAGSPRRSRSALSASRSTP